MYVYSLIAIMCIERDRGTERERERERERESERERARQRVNGEGFAAGVRNRAS